MRFRGILHGRGGILGGWGWGGGGMITIMLLPLASMHKTPVFTALLLLHASLHTNLQDWVL